MVPVMISPPRPALLLGLGGLLPPLAACVVVLAGPVEWHATAATVCATYDAVILSFLGGAWWGLAARGDLPRPLGGVLAASVLPALAGWCAMLIARTVGLMLLGLLFLVALSGDAWLARKRLAPAWWMRLRVPLSLGMAAIALVTGVATAQG